MKFSTTELRNNTVDGPVVFDEMVDVSELENLNNDIRQINPVRVKGICTADKDEFIFSFSIEGKMILPCARTLVDVDRKSTRLNSSHVSISYAVFCVK